MPVVEGRGRARANSIALFLMLLGAWGCGTSANFTVIRPAQVNARIYGGTVTVIPFAGHPEGARLVTRDLIERVRSAPGGIVRLSPRGGGLLVQGDVLDFSYVEHRQHQNIACPQTMNRERLGLEQQCSGERREGYARVEILFEVLVTATGERLASARLVDEMVHTSQNTYGIPAPLNGQDMLSQLVQGLVGRFARVILPWPQRVQVRLGRCGDAREHCSRGAQALQQNEFRLAARAFTRALRQLRRVEEPNPRHLAQAYWNLGLALEYDGEYEGAIRAIRRARRFDRRNDDYLAELQNIERLQVEQEELVRQGVE
jgi:hypothetical protein